MPQFRVQRSNTHFFFQNFATFFFDTKCETHKKQEQERDKNKNKNANNTTNNLKTTIQHVKHKIEVSLKLPLSIQTQ